MRLLNKICTALKYLCFPKSISILKGLEKTVSLHMTKYAIDRYIATLTRWVKFYHFISFTIKRSNYYGFIRDV